MITKILVALVTVLCVFVSQLPTKAQSQARSADLGLLGSIAVSRGLGYEPFSFGGEFYADYKPFERLAITNFFSVESARKIQTGDGILMRNRLAGRFYITPNIWLGGGGEFHRQSTSLWVKTGRRATFNAGGDFLVDRANVRPYITVLFPDTTNERTRGVRVGLEVKCQFEDSKWGIITRSEFSYLRFIEPFGRLSGNSGSFRAGIFRKF